jgi:adenylate cyclase
MGRLSLAYSEGGQDKIIELVEPCITIGRSIECDVVIDRVDISRRHAQLRKDGMNYWLVDLGSSNGSSVNQTRVDSVLLKIGDTIELGKMTFRYLELPDRPATAVTWLGGSTVLGAGAEAVRVRKTCHLERDDISRLKESDSLVREAIAFLSGLGTEEEALERIGSRIHELLKPVGVGIAYVVEGSRCEWICRWRDGQIREEPEVLAYAQGLCQEAVNMGRGVLGSVQSISPNGETSWIACVPVWRRRDVFGVIAVESSESERFTIADLERLMTCGYLFGCGIEYTRMSQELRRERSARHRLEIYHAPAVLERLYRLRTTQWRAGASEERNVSVVFGDIRGFTPLAETHDPHSVTSVLNGHFDMVSEVVSKHEGTLDKYIGDAFMAVFGAPQDQPDHALRSARCALEIMSRNAELNEARPATFKLSLRIGINSGRVVAGDIGSISRREYTVIGNAVNVAARLQVQVAQANEIILGSATHDLVAASVAAESLGQVELKGISHPLEAYRLLGLR